VNEAVSADPQESSIVNKVSTWALLLPLLYISGVMLSSSQDRPMGDLMGPSISGPWEMIDRSSKLIFAVVVLWLMASRWRAVILTASRQLWLVLIVSLAFISILWTQDAGRTATQALWFAINTCFILWFASRFQWRTQMRLLMLTTTVGALLSIVAIVAFPSRGLDTLHGGVWQGMYYSKNNLGRVMLFMLMPAFHLRLPKGRAIPLILRVSYIGLLVMLIVKSESKTAIILMCFYLVYWSAVRIVTRFDALTRVAMLALGLLCSGVAVLFVLPNLDSFLRIFGGDSSLTGRTTIWAALLISAMKHLSLGYGYQGFWVSGDSEGSNAFMRVYAMMHFTMSYSHSGYLDVVLQLGLVGLSVIVFCLVRSAARCYSVFKRCWCAEAEWATGVLLITILYNIDEVTFIQQCSVVWMLFVLSTISLARLADQASARNRIALAFAGEP
jgi:exopolysaccharide production protein ExoQ